MREKREKEAQEKEEKERKEREDRERKEKEEKEKKERKKEERKEWRRVPDYQNDNTGVLRIARGPVFSVFMVLGGNATVEYNQQRPAERGQEGGGRAASIGNINR